MRSRPRPRSSSSQSSTQGLSADEAARRLEADGPNRLPAGKPRSLFARVFAQFNNLLIYVLLASAVVTILLRHALDAVVILAVVLINGDDRLHPGRPGGKVARGHSRDADARVLGPARRAAADRSRRKPRGRRRRADRSRRPHSRRPEALARDEPQDRGSGADRRSGRIRQGDRSRRARRGARRPRLDGLFRHDGRERPGRGARGRDRRRDRAWAHQRHGRGRRNADHAAPASDERLRQAPDDRHSGARRLRLRFRRSWRAATRSSMRSWPRSASPSPRFPKACRR